MKGSFVGNVVFVIGGERSDLRKDAIEIYSPDGECRLTLPFTLDGDKVERASKTIFLFFLYQIYFIMMQ